MKVKDVMSHDVKLVTPNDTVETAARLMAELDVGVLPIGENDRLVGIVTDRDITIRAVASGKSPIETTVREVMSPGVKYVFEDESTQDAARKMADLQVRRLPVLNRAKRLVGIVSLGEINIGSDMTELLLRPGTRRSWLGRPSVMFVALVTVTALSSAEAASVSPSQSKSTETELGGTPPKGALQTQPPAAGIAKSAEPGVLKPKTNPDPGMAIATPNPGAFPMPVIPPPGTKSGNPEVVPK